VLVQRVTRRPGALAKLDIARSALVISTSLQQVWLVPAGRELCSVEMNPRSGPLGGYEACTGRRYAELHGLQLGVGGTTFNAVLPEHTSPVQVTFTDGSSIQLHANANGVITYIFSKLARLISYTGPTGLKIRLHPLAYSPRPPCPNRADRTKTCS